MDSAQNIDLAYFFVDWSQSEKLSEIKPPLKGPYIFKLIDLQIYLLHSFEIQWKP